MLAFLEIISSNITFVMIQQFFLQKSRVIIQLLLFSFIITKQYYIPLFFQIWLQKISKGHPNQFMNNQFFQHNSKEAPFLLDKVQVSRNLNGGDSNKDSVNTSIGSVVEYQINNNLENKKIQKEISFLINKKTQLICKKKQKSNLPVLKHKRVLQTLRNITQNIKSQLFTKNAVRTQNAPQIKQPSSIRLSKIQPEINIIRNSSIGRSEMIEQASQSQLVQNIKKEEELPFLSPVAVAASPNKKSLSLNNSNQKSGKQQKSSRIESLFLYSKQKNRLEKFCVYEDRILTDKKQFRNMTIQRMVDNDASSDQQQVQMGVGFMYYELLNSCQKQTQRKRQQKLKISQFKNNLKSNIKNSIMQKRNVSKNQIPFEKIKQKLVFN